MAVTALVSGDTSVNKLVTANGQATGAETLTGYEWQVADGEGAAFVAIAGATSQTYTIAASLRCRWLRVRITFDDGGNTVYAYSVAKRVGPCGGGHGKAISGKQPLPAAAPQADEPAPAVRKGLRRIYKVDTSKWVEGRRPR